MTEPIAFFATAARGLESLLAEELQSLGAQNVREARAGVHFSGPLAMGYRVCLWSRLASRLLLPLAEFTVADAEELYRSVATIAWADHLDVDGTLAVDCNVSGTALTHSRYAALKVKDAIVDQFRSRTGRRPSVEVQQPDVRINLLVRQHQAVISLDLSGESLHRRGYRQESGLAPLKETLAAALLLRCGWPALAAAGRPLLDPLCGAGTLVIEGALQALDIAPGLLRSHFGFLGWQGHQPEVWQDLLDEARQRRAEAAAGPKMVGYDLSPGAIKAAWSNAERAGLTQNVHFERRSVQDLASSPLGAEGPGLVITNPPYGERLGDEAELGTLYAQLGEGLRDGFPGWQAAVFTGNPDLGKHMGIRARKYHAFYNGALPCRLLHFTVIPEYLLAGSAGTPPKPLAPLSPGAEMFANRLRKNLKGLQRWVRQDQVSCYRLYDRDLPDYAVAIDRYGDWVHVQEYQAPAQIDASRAQQRLREVMAVLPEVLAVAPERLVLKIRQRQKGASQYQRLDRRQNFIEVQEDDCTFLVNLGDYLDTGLFLDHRPVRRMLRELAAGKRFLNLFAYTATATVHAARGGAVRTVSVDMSAPYLDWARRNLEINGFRPPNHQLVQADILQWLRQEQERFDLIFLDPPTFSNSKRMAGAFDVQRDHVDLLQQTARLLAPGGELIFSNNFRGFKLDADALSDLIIEDLSARTIPFDFRRNPRIHSCWRIRRP